MVAVAAAVLEVAEKSPSDEPKGCLEKCLPFVTGIVHIIQHSNISQVSGLSVQLLLRVQLSWAILNNMCCSVVTAVLGLVPCEHCVTGKQPASIWCQLKSIKHNQVGTQTFYSVTAMPAVAEEVS